MNRFRQYNYFKYTEQEYKQIWETALFVFDTSALLNLYRYKTSTQDDFIKALQHLCTRIWIPHHVDLEINKNRLLVISQEIEKFNKTKEAVNSIKKSFVSEINKLSLKNVHKIDSVGISSKIQTLIDEIKNDLDNQIRSEINLRSLDPIENILENLFNGNVGSPPSKQEDVNDMEKKAEIRFKNKIAPGYEDDNKDEVCLDKGLLYKKKYSDFIIWKQILEHAPTVGSKNLIFVTGDSKKGDWFLKFSSNGQNLSQPKPELLDEAYNIGKLDNFLMYDSEEFITFAKQYFELDISTETIVEVADTNKALDEEDKIHFSYELKRKSAINFKKLQALIKVKKFEAQLEAELIRNKGILDYQADVLNCPECGLRTMIPNINSYTGYECTYCNNEESDDIEDTCGMCGTSWSSYNLASIPIDDEGHTELICPYCRRDPEFVDDD